MPQTGPRYRLSTYVGGYCLILLVIWAPIVLLSIEVGLIWKGSTHWVLLVLGPLATILFTASFLKWREMVETAYSADRPSEPLSREEEQSFYALARSVNQESRDRANKRSLHVAVTLIGVVPVFIIAILIAKFTLYFWPKLSTFAVVLTLVVICCGAWGPISELIANWLFKKFKRKSH